MFASSETEMLEMVKTMFTANAYREKCLQILRIE